MTIECLLKLNNIISKSVRRENFKIDTRKYRYLTRRYSSFFIVIDSVVRCCSRDENFKIDFNYNFEFYFDKIGEISIVNY